MKAVIITTPDDEIVIIELKGYDSQQIINLGTETEKNTVKWFFSNTFLFAKSILSDQFSAPKICGCYITTATFKKSAVEFLNDLNKGKLKPFDLDTWYDGSKLINLLEAKKMKKVLKIIQRYYFKETLK